MRQCLGPLLAAALVMGVSAQQPQQAQQPSQPPPSTGLILGQVIDAGTNRPVPGALVTLGGGRGGGAGAGGPVAITPEQAQMMAQMGVAGVPGAPGQRRALTDRDGRFVFRDLTAGSYTATVTLTGYAPGALGRKRFDGPPRPVDVGEGERVLDATVRLWRLASITGTVVDEAGEPVVGLSVRALRRSIAGGRRRYTPGASAQTDDRGMYRLASLTPGDYVVAIPASVTTVPTSAVEEWFEALRSGSAATFSQRRTESGAPMTSAGGIAVGDHQVQVSTSPLSNQSSVLPPGADGRLFIYRTIFYSASTSLSQATGVTLESGAARTGVDFSLKPVPTVRVSGTMTGPDGPSVNLGVRLVPDSEELATNSGFETAISMTDAAGRFTFLGVPSGQYALQAYRIPRPEMASAMTESLSVVGGVAAVGPAGPIPAAPAGPSFFAQTTVVVGDADVADVALSLRLGARVSGRLEFEGSAPKPDAQRLQLLSVSLQSADGRTTAGLFVPPVRADAEGRFTTGGNAPGRYWLNVPPPGPEWVVKSVMAGGVNALDRPIEIAADDLAGVVITFTDRPAELSGTVQTGSAGPDDDVLVYVFPADYQAWIANGRSPRRVASTSAARNGTFTLRMPPPGEYFVAALINENAPEGEASVLAAVARNATRMSIVEGEKKTVTLTAGRIR